MSHLRYLGNALEIARRVGANVDAVDGILAGIPVYENPRLRRTFGRARRILNRDERTLRFSIELHSAVMADAEELLDTFAHELAHVGEWNDGHGRKWAALARRLGGTGKATATREQSKRIGIPERQRRARRIVATCERCGLELWRARALPSGRVYSHRGCGGRFESR